MFIYRCYFEMWDIKACRACLSSEGKLEKIGDASKRIYAAVAGLEVSKELLKTAVTTPHAK